MVFMFYIISKLAYTMHTFWAVAMLSLLIISRYLSSFRIEAMWYFTLQGYQNLSIFLMYKGTKYFSCFMSLH